MKELVGEISDQQASQHLQYYLQHFKNNWRPFDDVIPCLERLHGYRLGIITNGDLNQQKQKLERMGISDHFEVVIASGDVGFSKPNIRIFELAAEISGHPLHDITYIGDDFATDIIPCEELNIKGIWLNRRSERSEWPTELTITTLYEIGNVL